MMLPAAASLLAVACAGVASEPTTVSAQLSRDVSAVRLATPYGAGLTESPGCQSAHARAFNFWLGDWSVYGPDGVAVGTNRVTPALGGCAVLEAWVDASGFPGRSLSSWDVNSKRWRQMYVDAGNTTLLLEGDEVRRGVIELKQDRPSQLGGPLRLDVLTWTQRGADVQQRWRASLDSGRTFETLFDGRYQRAVIQRPAPRLVGTCTSPARPRFFDFDFTLGRWQVVRDLATGAEPLGESLIVKDMENCLLVETFAGTTPARGGAIGFGSFDTIVRRWHREFADAWGRRLVLSDGGLSGNSMVLRGSVRSQGRKFQLRVTWEPLTPDRFLQRWETSSDDGATWSLEHSLRFDRIP